MTPDACPFCGAQRNGSPEYIPLFTTSFACGTWMVRHQESDRWRLHQSPECARYVRTRISQLRRMAEACWVVFDRWNDYRHQGPRLNRFASRIQRLERACLREITRHQEAQRGTA